MTLCNAAAFFERLRTGLLGPRLSPSEVEGANALLAACNGLPIAHAAYVLATAYHETAHTMLPVKEYGCEAYFTRMYDPLGQRPHIAARLGNIQPGDGAKYCGRGYVQLTGRANYAKAGGHLGHPLVDQPELAERADLAATILRLGMAEGWFTGVRLSDILPAGGRASRAQFKAARRIVNGADKDVLIADYAISFQEALIAGVWSS